MPPEEFLRFARALSSLAWEEHALDKTLGPLSPDRISWDGARIRISFSPPPLQTARGAEEDSRKPGEGEEPALREEIRALGSLLFWVGTGEFFEDSGMLPTQLRRDLPRFWDGVLSNCLHENPMERFAHAGDLLGALPTLSPSASSPKEAASHSPARRTWILLTPLLLFFLLAAYLLGFEIHDHGRTYDDLVQRTRGEAMLEFLHSGNRQSLPGEDIEDFSRGDPLYGPFAATVSLWAGRLIAPWVGDPRTEFHLPFHAGLTLFGLLLVLCCYFLGLRFSKRPSAALASALLLLALPRVFGQLTSNPSDLPAAALMGLAAVQMFRWFDRPGFLRTLAFALALAALGATRLQNGGLMALICLPPILIRFFQGRRGRKEPLLPFKQLFLLPFLAYGLFILLWPDLWTSPLGGPLHLLRNFFSHQSRYTQGTLFFGSLQTKALTYPIVLFFITTPITITALFLLGVARKKIDLPRLFLLLWILLSLGKHLTGIANHGGIRHFLDAFVPIAVLAGTGLQRVLDLLVVPAWKPVANLGLPLLFVTLSFSTHPFESSYYNLLVGGTPGAVSRFDLDSNGSSFLVLMKKLRPQLHEGDILWIPGAKDLVTQIPLPPNCAVLPLRPDQRALIQKSIEAGLFKDRRCILLFHQGILWGVLDDLLREKKLEVLAQAGPKSLPLSLALRVKDPRDLLLVLRRLKEK